MNPLEIVQLKPKKKHPWPELSALRELDKGLEGVESEEPVPVAALMYAEYARAVKRLDEIWDKELQPQKGMAIKRLLDAAVCRLLELKELLCLLEISEYHYVDGAVIQLKLVPKDFEIWELQGVPAPRKDDIQDKIERLLVKGEKIYEPPVEEEETVEEEEQKQEEDTAGRRRKTIVQDESEVALPPPPPVELPKDPKYLAILLIQKHERARQYRLEYLDERTLYEYRNKIKRHKPIDEDKSNPAATTIQRFYRGYVARRDFKRREDQRRHMIGMYVPYWRPHEDYEKNAEVYKIKRELRERKLREYIESIDRERDRIVQFIGPGLAEDIGDEIRYWFRNWYDVAECFDQYPPPEEGGTVIVIRGETMTPEEYIENMEKMKKEQEMLKANPGLAEKMKAAADKAKKDEAEKAKKEAARLRREAAAAKDKVESDGPFKFPPAKQLEQLELAELAYGEDWVPGWEPDENPLAKPVMEPITTEMCYDLQLKIRKEVDRLMELELVMLEKALARQNKKKWKKPKKKKKGKGKVPGGPFDNRVDQIFQELYDNEIIRPYPMVTMKDFVGDYSYANSDFRIRPGPPLDPKPTVGEARQLVWTTCIFPLGTTCVNVPRPKAVALVGPRQSGKKLLVNAICNETKAVMFDLTPKNLVGKYQQKDEKRNLIQYVIFLSKLLQPSVIFIDGAEKPFYKKVPKLERKQNPKAVKGIITPVLKKILPEDRIMLIATTKAPQAASPRLFIKTYERFILIPRPDYGTTYRLWEELLMKYKNVPRNIDLSSLSQVTKGYPVPFIRELVQKIMTPRRLISMPYKPFKPAEIVEYLVTGKGVEPVGEEESDEIFDWYNQRISMGKRLTEKLQAAEAQRILEEAQAAKAAKKKG